MAMAADQQSKLWFWANYAAAQTDLEVIAGVQSTRIFITDLIISTDTAQNVQLEYANIDVIPPLYLAANGGVTISTFGRGIPVPSGEGVDLTSSAAGNLSIGIGYYLAP